MKNYDHVFKALPHVTEIWVTEDGHFHLHPHNGGEQISKDSIGLGLSPAKIPVDSSNNTGQPSPSVKNENGNANSQRRGRPSNNK